MAYTGISVCLLYMMKLKPGFKMFLVSLVNVPFYSIEIKHKIFKVLNLHVEKEFGSVECNFFSKILAELLCTIIFWGCSLMGIEKLNIDYFDCLFSSTI